MHQDPFFWNKPSDVGLTRHTKKLLTPAMKEHLTPQPSNIIKITERIPCYVQE